MKITHIHILKRMDFFGNPRETKSGFAAWSAMTHSCAAPQITALFKPTPGSSTILWPFPTRPCSNCRVSPIGLLIKTPCHVLFRHLLHGCCAIKWLRSTHFSPSLLHPNHFHSCLMANESSRRFFLRGCYVRRGPLTSMKSLLYFPFTSASCWPLAWNDCDGDPKEAGAFSLERHLMKM